MNDEEIAGISHVSATSIKLFKNCQRRWYETYVLDQRGESSPAMRLGSEVHELLEEYLLKGTKPGASKAGKIASAGLKYLPKRTKNYRVEASLADFPRPGLPIQFKGFIDLYIEGDVPEIIDHKTTSNFRYALTAEQLATDTQMIIYAAHVLANVEAEEVSLTHIAYLTKAPHGAQRTTVTVTREAVEEQFADILLTVAEMIAASTAPIITIEKNNTFCWSYGKICPFYNQCQVTMNNIGVKNMSDKQLAVLDKLRGIEKKKPMVEALNEGNAPTPAPTPAPAQVTLFVDVGVLKGDPITRVDDALAPLVNKVCKSKGADHIALVAYNAGYHLLSSLIVEEGLPAGEYAVDSNSDFWKHCSTALCGVATKIVRGYK